VSRTTPEEGCPAGYDDASTHGGQTNSTKTVREGWNMEETMTQLELITEGMRPERWMAYVYEIRWVLC